MSSLFDYEEPKKPKILKKESDFNEYIKKSKMLVFNFKDGLLESQNVEETFQEMCDQRPNITFVVVYIKKFPNLCKKYGVKSCAFLYFKNGREFELYRVYDRDQYLMVKYIDDLQKDLIPKPFVPPPMTDYKKKKKYKKTNELNEFYVKKLKDMGIDYKNDPNTAKLLLPDLYNQFKIDLYKSIEVPDDEKGGRQDDSDDGIDFQPKKINIQHFGKKKKKEEPKLTDDQKKDLEKYYSIKDFTFDDFNDWLSKISVNVNNLYNFTDDEYDDNPSDNDDDSKTDLNNNYIGNYIIYYYKKYGDPDRNVIIKDDIIKEPLLFIIGKIIDIKDNKYYVQNIMNKQHRNRKISSKYCQFITKDDVDGIDRDHDTLYKNDTSLIDYGLVCYDNSDDIKYSNSNTEYIDVHDIMKYYDNIVSNYFNNEIKKDRDNTEANDEYLFIKIMFKYNIPRSFHAHLFEIYNNEYFKVYNRKFDASALKFDEWQPPPINDHHLYYENPEEMEHIFNSYNDDDDDDIDDDTKNDDIKIDQLLNDDSNFNDKPFGLNSVVLYPDQLEISSMIVNTGLSKINFEGKLKENPSVFNIGKIVKIFNDTNEYEIQNLQDSAQIKTKVKKDLICPYNINKFIPLKNDENVKFYNIETSEWQQGTVEGKLNSFSYFVDGNVCPLHFIKMIEIKIACKCGNDLKKFITLEDNFKCDACVLKFGNDNTPILPKNTILYGCRKCNYDVCKKCYNFK